MHRRGWARDPSILRFRGSQGEPELANFHHARKAHGLTRSRSTGRDLSDLGRLSTCSDDFRLRGGGAASRRPQLTSRL